MLRTWASVLVALSTVGCTLDDARRSGHALTHPISITIPTVPSGLESLNATPILVVLEYIWTDNLPDLDPPAPHLSGHLQSSIPLDEKFFAGGFGVRAVDVVVNLPEGLPAGFACQLTAILRRSPSGQTVQTSTYPIFVDQSPPVLHAARTVRTDSSLTITTRLSDLGSGIATVSTQPTVNGLSTPPQPLGFVSGDMFTPTDYSGTLGGLGRLDVVGLGLTALDRDGNALLVPGLPVANNEGSYTKTCDSPTGATVLVDGSRSTGTSLSYLWSGQFGSLTGITTMAPLGLGANSVTLTVTDGRGFTGTQTSVITIADLVPPVLSVAATTACIWPPNNKLVALSLSTDIQFTTSDVCDPNPKVRILSVTSSDGTPVSFNGERACVVAQKGIVYTITVEARDNAGNTMLASTTVTVPHSSADGCKQPTLKADDPACTF